jgi:DNA-directed RNA polymerase specialized sigma24 family protein
MAFLDPSTRDALDQLRKADVAGAEPLERLRLLRSAAAALDTDGAILASVRESGAGWDEIAAAAGLSLSAAKWRWQGTNAEIADRHEQGRKRSERPSSVPTDLPGLSVAEAAKSLNLSAQAIYLRVSRGQLRSETVERAGRSYKRVFPE